MFLTCLHVFLMTSQIHLIIIMTRMIDYNLIVNHTLSYSRDRKQMKDYTYRLKSSGKNMWCSLVLEKFDNSSC